MDPVALIEEHSGELRALGMKRIGVFGSLHELLENAFGRPVDLVTDGSLSEGKARLVLPTVRYADA